MSYVNNAYTTVIKPEGVKNAAPATATEAKEKIARLFTVKKPENVIFTKDEIQAMNIAIRSLVKPGDHIITTVCEQAAVLQILDDMKAEGVEVTYIGVNPYGELKYHDIDGAVRENTTALVVCHGSNLTGNLTDMERVTTIARRHKLVVISDGSQSAGAADINLEALGIDVYCFSGHRKLMGPYGIGGICLKEGIALDQNLLDSIGEIDGRLYGGLCVALDFIKEKAFALTLKMIARLKNAKETRIETVKENGFMYIICSAVENGADLMSVKLMVTDETQALSIKERFLDNPSLVYTGLVDLLTSDK